jgi:hypothetical protein
VSIRIEITATPRRLDALEELCAVARQQGFPDNAYVTNNGTELTVRSDPDELEPAEVSR